MNRKKIIWLTILIAIIGISLGILITATPKTNETNVTNKIDSRKTENNSETQKNQKEETIKTEKNDGVLYSLSQEEIKPDLIIGDNYFDTQINDMMMNYKSYKNKKIEVEGMYLENSPFTFVGRYSTSNLCVYCPVGYSYIEYEWNGENIELVDEQSWIKVIGTLEVGNDITSNYEDYYYIKALSIEVMNERGQETVNN